MAKLDTKVNLELKLHKKYRDTLALMLDTMVTGLTQIRDGFNTCKNAVHAYCQVVDQLEEQEVFNLGGVDDGTEESEGPVSIDTEP
jgi:hypothetical protein